MKTFKLNLTMLSFFLIALTTFGQKNDTLEIFRNNYGIIQYASFSPSASFQNMQNDTAFLKSMLNARKEDNFRLVSTSIDRYGAIHKRFQQYYENIKVENAQYLTHWNNNIITEINGDFQKISPLTLVPTFSASEALTKALVYSSKKI